MKEELIKRLVSHIQHELSTLIEAANNAHLAAIDDQSVAETQYDTLAIEAGYLAEGQSRRVNELTNAVNNLTAMTFTDSKNVGLGSLVQLSQDVTINHWFFIAPAAAGFKCEVDGKHVTVITPSSPMAKVLWGKEAGDEISLNISANAYDDDIHLVH